MTQQGGLTPAQAKKAYHAKRPVVKISSSQQVLSSPNTYGTKGIRVLKSPNQISKLKGMQTGGSRPKVHL